MDYKDTLKIHILLIFMMCGYSQGNKHMHFALHGVCPQSTKTIKYVPSCPTTEGAWKEREEQKRCEDVKQNCVPMERFVYHCAVNEWRNATLEVCAPLRIIFGRCVEYNVLGKRIQFNRERCTTFSKPCPRHYQSTDVYQYPECFKTISKYTPYVSDDSPQIFAETKVDIILDSGRGIDMSEHIIKRNNGQRKHPMLSLLSFNVMSALLHYSVMSNG